MKKDNGMRGDNDHLTAPSRALKNNNFECFDVMLSLLSHCGDTHTDIALMDNIETLLTWDTPVVAHYLNNKFVQN